MAPRTMAPRTMPPRTMARATVRGTARAGRNSSERLTALYLDMLAAERGAGKNTLAAYGRDLTDFAEHLAGTGRSIATASTEDLRAYLGALARRGMTAATVARRLSAIRQLYRFLYAEGQRKDDPAAVLEGPKRVRALPKTLTLAEVDRLLRVATICDPAAPLAVRLRAARLACLVEMLYATGLRVSELVALPASAARHDARVIVVRGKGNKERLVPLNDAAKRATAAYLALLAQSGREAKSKWLFPSFGESRSPHPPAPRPRTENPRRRRGPAHLTSKPARAAPRFRQPPPAQRRRPARGADAARPRRHFDHADLHPCARRTPEKPRPRFAPPGAGMTGNKMPLGPLLDLYALRREFCPDERRTPSINLAQIGLSDA